MPERGDLLSLCRELLAASDSALWAIPASIQQTYSLRPLNDDEQSKFDLDSYNHASKYSPPVGYEAFVAFAESRGYSVQCIEAADACDVSDSSAPELGLRFILWRNHWFVQTLSGRIYTCQDSEVEGLCLYALKKDEAIADEFPQDFCNGYSMWEIPDDWKREITSQIGLDTKP